MIKHILLIGSLLVSGSVFAELKGEWIAIAKSNVIIKMVNKQRMIVVDVESQMLELWVKSKILKLVPEYGFKPNDILLSKHRFNCKIKMMKDFSYTMYRNENAPVTQTTKNGEWYEVLPESVDEGLLNRVCEYQFPKSTS